MSEQQEASGAGFTSLWVGAALTAIGAVISLGVSGWVETVLDQPLLEYHLAPEAIDMPDRPLANRATVGLHNLAKEPPTAHVIVVLHMVDPNTDGLEFFEDATHKSEIVPIPPTAGDGFADDLGVEIQFHLTRLTPQDRLRLVGYYTGTKRPTVTCKPADTTAAPWCMRAGTITWVVRNKALIFVTAIVSGITALLCLAVVSFLWWHGSRRSPATSLPNSPERKSSANPLPKQQSTHSNDTPKLGDGSTAADNQPMPDAGTRSPGPHG